jgi:hypothetical protein
MTPYSPNLPMISPPVVPGSRFAIINHNATSDEKKTLDFFEQSLQKGIERFSRSIQSSTEQNKINTIITTTLKAIVNTKIPFMESLSEETTTEEGRSQQILFLQMKKSSKKEVVHLQLLLVVQIKPQIRQQLSQIARMSCLNYRN